VRHRGFLFHLDQPDQPDQPDQRVEDGEQKRKGRKGGNKVNRILSLFIDGEEITVGLLWLVGSRPPA
jgi:hypothetical protein